jgi:hypothetical protein
MESPSPKSGFDRTAWQRQWRERNRERARELSRQSAARNREKRNAYYKAYYQRNRDRELSQAKRRQASLKDAAYAAYGGYRCACCAETQVTFLCIDHVNNDGYQHRKQIGRGSNIYLWLRKHGYPQGFQVLCMNCNFGKKHNNGVCPHVEAQYGIEIVEIGRKVGSGNPASQAKRAVRFGAKRKTHARKVATVSR